jgi:RNA polymerase sigma-70 factor (ECF subfamily)
MERESIMQQYTALRTAGSDVCQPASATRSSQSDLEIIRRCKQGDRAAWEILIARYRPSLIKFAYSLSRNHDDAADIVSLVLTRVFENIHCFRNEASFTSWLFCITRNVYIDFCVRAPHRSHLSMDEGVEMDGDRLAREIVDPSPTPEARAVEAERHQLLSSAISHLPAYQRIMMVMYHAENRSYEEIAATTGLAIGTVKSRLSRARQMLRRRLEGMEELMEV